MTNETIKFEVGFLPVFFGGFTPKKPGVSTPVSEPWNVIIFLETTMDEDWAYNLGCLGELLVLTLIVCY